MRPLYDAWIEDLGPGDFLKVECAACGHDLLIPLIGLLQGWRLPPYMRVLALEPRFRCRECDQRGKVMLSIRWPAVNALAFRLWSTLKFIILQSPSGIRSEPNGARIKVQTDRLPGRRLGHPPGQLRTLGPELGQHQNRRRLDWPSSLGLRL